MGIQGPLNAAAMTAGALMSTSIFEVPIYQREYAWTNEEVADFWEDISDALFGDSYFMGLLILTKEKDVYHVVDGQQRILTLTILAAALRDEALKHGRRTLAEKIRSDFLKTINYDTDETESRVRLADASDNDTLQGIIDGEVATASESTEGVSRKIIDAYKLISKRLQDEISSDPFKKLGVWTEFVTDKLYFAVFVHPDASSAYKVFEAINTRGRDLTTAELLKNYVLSQTKPAERQALYTEWQSVALQFPSDGANSFVQYIRHVVTVQVGHVLPKDLFDLIAGRGSFAKVKDRPTIDQLVSMLKSNLANYAQIVDPTAPGEIAQGSLKVFEALNYLSVLSVRPIILAVLSRFQDPQPKLEELLRFVVQRIVTGNLGTGNVERRFGEAAKHISMGTAWEQVMSDFVDLRPSREDFISQLSRRSLNRQVLTFVRRSMIEKTITPSSEGYFHLIRPKQLVDWPGFEPEDVTFWTNTFGNSVILKTPSRDRAATVWSKFKSTMLTEAADGELVDELEARDDWDAKAIEAVGAKAAGNAADVWY